MARVEESIDVNVPVRTAYNQWPQFEEITRFMGGVKSVTQHDDTRPTWVAEVAGNENQWEAEITEQIPDTKIAWTATEGARNAGVVDFYRIDDNQTRVHLQMEVEPEGPIESTGAALGLRQGQVKKDLEKFKEFIESRGQETGAWRGEVQQSKVG